jgi:hypothetical protein
MLPFGLPLCPTRALFHLDCPACGATRGVLDLLRGDLVGALDHNLLLLVALPLGVLALTNRLRGQPSGLAPLPRWTLGAGLVVLVAFTVLRNAGPPAVAWLDAA